MNAGTQKFARLGLGVAAVAALLAGCASSGTSSGSRAGADSSRSGSSAGTPAPGGPEAVTVSEGVRIVHDDWARLGYRWEWSNTPQIGRRAEVEFVEYGRDRIVVQDSETRTTVLNASSGQTIWAFPVATPRTRFLGHDVVDDRTLLSYSTPALYGLELGTGNQLARQRTERLVSTAPALVGGLAVFGTPQGELLAHRFAGGEGQLLAGIYRDGVVAWRYGLTGAITARPIVVGEYVAAVSQAGDVVFINPVTASAIGRGRISGGSATTPVTDGELMFIASEDQSVYAYRPFGAERVWRYRTATPLRIQPAVLGDVLYCEVEGVGLHAFDAQTGDVEWIAEGVGGTVLGTRNRELLVWDARARELNLIDRSEGDVIQRVELPDVERLLADGGSDPRLFAVGESGVVIAFGTR